VLFLTTEFPSPATSGGPVRTLAQLRTMAALPEVERITLLSVSERAVSDAQCGALAAAVPKLDVRRPIFHPIHLWRQPRCVPRVLALRLRGVPYLAAKWDSPALRRAVRHQLRQCAFDVVYVDHLGMTRYLSDVRAERRRPRVVLDQHNVESDLYGQLAETCGGLRRQLLRVEWRAAAGYERDMLQAVDAVVGISDADADRFTRIAGVRTHVVPVAIDIERRSRPQPGAPHFCYVGSLRWRPNVDGLDWFCQHVWPRIRVRLPDATMEIAGVDLASDAQGRPVVPAAWNVPGIETVGFLADLEPLYGRSLALLAPVRGGSGVRMKVLEGFRAGLPIVTTSDGAAGLFLTDGSDALIADDPGAFAERVERLVRAPDLRTRLRDAGYRFLETRHSLAVAQRALRPALGIAS
jgi:glycosyltransferase involved in cell wall biosynthesis